MELQIVQKKYTALPSALNVAQTSIILKMNVYAKTRSAVGHVVVVKMTNWHER